MGDHPTQIEPYALFEMESSTAGLLIPRMTSRQRDSAFLEDIPNGLLLFNLDKQCVEVYQGRLQKWECVGAKTLQLIDNKLIWGQKQIDLSVYLDNTDTQQLTLVRDTLRLENGGLVDLSPYKPEAIFPSITHFALKGHALELSISKNREDLRQVDFSSLLSTPKIDLFALQSNTLEISLAKDDEPPLRVDFSSLLAASSPQLILQGHQLGLSAQNTVDLSPYLDNTDGQQLGFNLTSSQTFEFTLSNSKPLRVEVEAPLTFDSSSTQLLKIKSKSSPFESQHNITHNSSPTWATHHFVFGSSALDNLTQTKTDNKRFFFNKDKGAFRAGIAESDQWDDKNIGTYSIALGRNTIASSYHATALGSKTIAEAWYTTAMGVGTTAL
jgi:hypothetical protein